MLLTEGIEMALVILTSPSGLWRHRILQWLQSKVMMGVLLRLIDGITAMMAAMVHAAEGHHPTPLIHGSALAAAILGHLAQFSNNPHAKLHALKGEQFDVKVATHVGLQAFLRRRALRIPL